MFFKDIPPQTSIETTKNDSETSSTGDADAATRALLERIGKFARFKF